MLAHKGQAPLPFPTANVVTIASNDETVMNVDKREEQYAFPLLPPTHDYTPQTYSSDDDSIPPLLQPWDDVSEYSSDDDSVPPLLRPWDNTLETSSSDEEEEDDDIPPLEDYESDSDSDSEYTPSE